MEYFVRCEASQAQLRAGASALLLEGNWPLELRAPGRDSLDRAIDSRHAWIDQQASDLAERLASDAVEETAPYSNALLANLSALRLRYFLVKLLRWTAYCRDVRPSRSGEQWRLHAGPGDEAYVALFRALCDAHGTEGTVTNAAEAFARSSGGTSVPLWRRWLTPLLATKADGKAIESMGDAMGKRTLFAGDSNVLGPLCAELARRGQETAWLCDEPVLKARLRMPRVAQMVCEGRRGARNHFAKVEVPSLRTDDGVELSGPVQCWLERTRVEQGALWARWLEAMERHFARFRPDRLILGEDATPFSRAAVLTARRYGVRSVVVQHGAPGVRFGFAPLLADAFAAWDEASREQLIAWGMESERIEVSGSLPLQRSRARLSSRRTLRTPGKRITVLLLASVPARDERPDAVEYHLTRETHDGMLRDAAAVVGSLDNARVIVKLHPRCSDATEWRAALNKYPALKVQVVQKGHWTDWLTQADAVISCGSSAGIEAAQVGWPVVQLLPAGSGEVLASPDWGLIGSARNAVELRAMLQRALRRGRRPMEAAAADSAVRRTCDWIEQRDGGHSRNSTPREREEALCLHI